MTKEELREKLARQANQLLNKLLRDDEIDPGWLRLFTETVTAMNALESTALKLIGRGQWSRRGKAGELGRQMAITFKSFTSALSGVHLFTP